MQRFPRSVALVVRDALELQPFACHSPLTTVLAMKIRPYRLSDLETLYKIDQECFAPGISYSREELARFIHRRNTRAWVAESEGKIRGFVVADLEPQKVGHIVTIDVIHSGRRSGIGKALMETVEAWGEQQGLRLIYLETADDNAIAHRFYAGRSYLKVKEIRNYYPNGRTAWVMVKWLNGRQGSQLKGRRDWGYEQ